MPSVIGLIGLLVILVLGWILRAKYPDKPKPFAKVIPKGFKIKVFEHGKTYYAYEGYFTTVGYKFSSNGGLTWSTIKTVDPPVFDNEYKTVDLLLTRVTDVHIIQNNVNMRFNTLEKCLAHNEAVKKECYDYRTKKDKAERLQEENIENQEKSAIEKLKNYL